MNSISLNSVDWEKTLLHKDMTFLLHVGCVCVCVCVGGGGGGGGEGVWIMMCREVKSLS